MVVVLVVVCSLEKAVPLKKSMKRAWEGEDEGVGVGVVIVVAVVMGVILVAKLEVAMAEMRRPNERMAMRM